MNKKKSRSLDLNNTGGVIVLLILSAGFMGSCVTQLKVEYLQEADYTYKTFKESELSDYRLKPNDELYIQVSSLDEATSNIFSNTATQSSAGAMVSTPFSASLISHSIDRYGYLILPVIGSIYVKDKTLSEVSMILRDSLNHILHEPIVSVKLVNRYVTVLGEVRNPGHYPYSQDRLSIYDAIGLAGDITDYGNRNDVVLVRNENGENKRLSLDLTKSEILASGYYNIRPNDLIYVKPLRRRIWGMREFPFSILFSTITTGLLIYNIIR